MASSCFPLKLLWWNIDSRTLTLLSTASSEEGARVSLLCSMGGIVKSCPGAGTDVRFYKT